MIDLFSEIENRIESIEHTHFLEKFKPKKTNDDCYTPVIVYDIIANFVKTRYRIDGNIIRPFYPSHNYKTITYKINDFVIDNPPFSIITEICRYYIRNNVKFFLFAPHMTLFTANIDASYIVCGANIIYENGAIVKTSFITNLETDIKVFTAIDLYNELENVNKKSVSLPKYKYPNHILTVSNVQKYVENGINFTVYKKDSLHYKQLDAQKPLGKTIFGSGLLLADKAAADKAAADKAAADKANYIEFKLSEREQVLVKNMTNEY